MPNAVSAFLDDPVAGGAADRPAIVTPGGATTYRELLGQAGRCGNVLRGLGLEPEQRVALLLPDGVEWAATFFGALRIGAVAVPRSEEHTSELQSRLHLVCRLLLEKKKKKKSV